MSRLQQQLRWIRSPELVPPDPAHQTLSFLETDELVFAAPHWLRRSRLEARFRVEVLCAQNDPPEVEAQIRRDCERRILEEIFGEFREPLYKTLEYLHQRRWCQATQQLHQIHQQMFEVKP
jgi:hypothetical protein